MANPNQKVPGNVDGDFFVDTTCIDCDTCRWVAPASFDSQGEWSRVFRQPLGAAEREAAFKALLSCPTGSIGASGDKAALAKVRRELPWRLDGPVFHCGYASEFSFGAAAWFLETPEGNVLIDSPRFDAGLAKKLEEKGGVRWMWLSHRDDVADHAKWAARLGCQRILHRDDVLRGTREVEVQPEGLELFEIAPGLVMIPVPGHSKGHSVLLYENKYLFTGDHLAFDEEDSTRLRAFRGYTWHSWSEQIRSMERLAAYDFEWVIPGHGRLGHLPLPKMKQAMHECIAWMRQA